MNTFFFKLLFKIKYLSFISLKDYLVQLHSQDWQYSWMIGRPFNYDHWTLIFYLFRPVKKSNLYAKNLFKGLAILVMKYLKKIFNLSSVAYIYFLKWLSRNFAINLFCRVLLPHWSYIVEIFLVTFDTEHNSVLYKRITITTEILL